MSDATAWGWSREQKTGDIVIHGPPYPGKDDACDIVLVDGAYLCGDDAALIVNRVNAHDALVEACVTFERWLRREEAGLTLPEGCERDSVEGERIFQAWFDENLSVCRKAQTLARAALDAVGSGTERPSDE